MNNLLTVVIPAKNEENYIRTTLTALLNQTYITPDTPIYIADAGSTDHTLKIIDLFEGKLNIRVVKGGLPATGRNNGARYATTKYILFLDADIELGERDTLEKSIALAEKKDLDLVTTYIKCKDGGWADDFFWMLHGFSSKSKIFGAYGAGMFIMMKNEAFRKAGGFNEHLSLGEDWELTQKVSRRKFSVSDTFIYTTNRRFKMKGYLTTISQYIMAAASSTYRNETHPEYYDVKFN